VGNKRKNIEVPPLGTLVVITSYDRSGYVKVAAIGGDDGYACIPDGSCALVVGAYTRQSSTQNVPIVSVGDATGWIFHDEWVHVDEKD
jgi:hypothetical protein